MLSKKFLTIGAFICIVLAIADAKEDNSMDKFRLGRELGDYLIKGCSVVEGTIRTIGEAQLEAGSDKERAVTYRDITLDIKRAHGRQATQEKAIQVVCAERPAMTKTSLGPWSAWEEVDVTPNGKLLVILWNKDAKPPKWLGKPIQVARAVSNEEMIHAVWNVMEVHSTCSGGSVSIDETFKTAVQGKNTAILGYLVTYLMDSLSVRNIDKAAEFLCALVGNADIPQKGWNDICLWVALNYPRMSDSEKTRITSTLVRAASHEQLGLAKAGIEGLLCLAERKNLDMKRGLDAVSKERLIKNYRAIIPSERTNEKHREFEAQLGL